MDEELEIPKPEPKISDVEIILIGLFFIVLDAIDLIPIAGDITDIVAAPMGFYYWMKGINGATFVVAEVLDLIPVVQEIPSRTIGWGITVWLDRHPKALGKLELAIEAADAIEGNLGEAEEAAKENAAREAAQLQSDTQAAGHQPGRGGEESENAKPSEKTTESDAEAGAKETGRPSEERPPSEREEEIEEAGAETGQDDQERLREIDEARTRAADQRYQDITEPAAAKNPVDEAKKKYFAAPEPTPQATEENKLPGRVVSGDRFAQKQRESQQEQEVKRQKEEEERIQLEKLKQSQVVTEDEDQEKAA